MIRYDRLWDTMASRNVTQYRLIKQYNFSAGQIGRLKKNMHVSTHTIDTLCTILQCSIGDIVEYLPNDSTEAGIADSITDAAAEAPAEEPKAPSAPAKRKKAAPKKAETANKPVKAEKPKKASKTKKAEKKTAKSEKPRAEKKSKEGKESKKNR